MCNNDQIKFFRKRNKLFRCWCSFHINRDPQTTSDDTMPISVFSTVSVNFLLASLLNFIHILIDYILVNTRHRINIKSVKTYPGADVSSHTIYYQPRSTPNPNKIQRNSNEHRNFKNQDLRKGIQARINENLKKLHQIKGEYQNYGNVNENWCGI